MARSWVEAEDLDGSVIPNPAAIAVPGGWFLPALDAEADAAEWEADDAEWEAAG